MLLGAVAVRADPSFVFVHHLAPLLHRGAIVVDARPLRDCEKRTITGAHCLPALDLLGPHGRLISFRNILWRLGSAGLSGSEEVVVVGDRPEVREFVGGVLYLAGQRKVDLLSTPITGRGAVARASLGSPGRVPGSTRNPVFQGRVRERLIVFREELARALRGSDPPVLLDGRSVQEYWGVTIRARYGGHIPGARRLPAFELRRELAQGDFQVPPLAHPIVYANGPFSSIAYFALLRAGAGIAVRVYIGGWQAWAADGALPADSVTYPSPPVDAEAAAGTPPPPTRHGKGDRELVDWRVLTLLVGIGGLLLGSAGWVCCRRRHRRPR
jgi:thiosulfate/3-mercaptopyruvate sulfurtransferase